VRLSDSDRAILDGEAGRSASKAMEILVALGEIYGAESMLEVGSAQVSGVSYHNLDEAGLEWLEQMAEDGRARVIATLNPAGMDLERWQELSVDPGFASRQKRIVDAYGRMGIARACTCTPYLVGNLPAPAEHVAWSESSAVAFANTVLGARTNKEGGPSALAAALTGRTPAYGLHLDAGRAPQVEVRVEATVGPSTAAWGALGAALGKLSAGKVPLVQGLPRPRLEELKAFGAAAVTFGASPLVHIAGVTPEAASHPRPRESVVLGANDLEEAWASLVDPGDEVDLVCLGCPHASLGELARIAALLQGRSVARTTWICTARATAETARSIGIVQRIERSGAIVVADTCFVVAPLAGRGTLATDSAKGCYYSRGHNRLAVKLGTVERCLDAAVEGRWR